MSIINVGWVEGKREKKHATGDRRNGRRKTEGTLIIKMILLISLT
jgi:hypothetical protein